MLLLHFLVVHLLIRGHLLLLLEMVLVGHWDLWHCNIMFVLVQAHQLTFATAGTWPHLLLHSLQIIIKVNTKWTGRSHQKDPFS